MLKQNANSVVPKWGYSGLIIGVLTALGFFLISLTGVLNPLDRICYDVAMRLLAKLDAEQPSILLIHIDYDEQFGDAEALQTLSTLENLGAKQVVFNFLPRQVSPEFYQRASVHGNVLFGRSYIRDPINPDQFILEPLPKSAEGFAIPYGVVATPPGYHGIYREQKSYINVDNVFLPGLEKMASFHTEKGELTAQSEQRFLVKFVGPPGSIPNVSLDRLLQKDLIPEMVQDRNVFIGLGNSERVPGLNTPISLKGRMMSLLEFQANALNTLENNNPIQILTFPGDPLAPAGGRLDQCASLSTHQSSDGFEVDSHHIPSFLILGDVLFLVLESVVAIRGNTHDAWTSICPHPAT